MNKPTLQLPQHLLWEYNLERFDYAKNWFLVIERVVRRGNIREWRNTQHFYGIPKMLEVIERSKQLTERERAFARLYVHSDLNDVHRPRDYQAGNLPVVTNAAE